ncbi:MAG: efflux RND transporter permease subunit [Bacteroidetes bacterium]|nr:efflux RND transporter permease subunit [Bacteroidota bacterium]
MRSTIEYFVRYPVLANIIIALTIVGGALSLMNTNKSFFPTREPRNIVIQVAYPGASPEEMEEGVTLKIEEAIHNIVGIDEMYSKSSENFANITVVTLKGYDIDELYTEIKNSVDGISSFPVSAEKPIIYKQKPQTTAQWIGLTGDVDLLTLKRLGEEIEDDMINSGVISQVNVTGFTEREISIEVPEDNLLRYNLTFDQVVDAVRKNNMDISAGSIKAQDEEILIRSNAQQTDADLISEIVLRSNRDGSKLLLRDIASIKEQWSDRPNKWTINGKRAVFLEVKRLENEDLEEISEFVIQYAKDFNENNPEVHLEVAFNFMDYLGQRLKMLYGNGLLGLILVFIALGTFLSIRLSLWVAWGIPSSYLGMFFIGSFFGLTINMISLFGMIMVVGILVDDGIVIAENIFAHFEKTKNPITAAINGTMEVLPAVATSVTTTIVAFTPLLFLTGGFEFLRDMAIVVIASLAFSLAEAFFVLPAHLASHKILTVKTAGSTSARIRGKINGFIDYLRYGLYGRFLKWTMEYRFISLAILISIFPIMGGLLGGGIIKSTFFPNIPFTNFQIELVLKPGTREHTVENYLKDFEDKVWQVNDDLMREHKDTVDYIKFTFSGTGTTMNGSDQGTHAGGINVFYKELDDTPITTYDLIDRIREKIGDVPEAEKFIIGAQHRFGKPVSVKLLGRNQDQLDKAKDYLKKELKGLADLKEITDDLAIGNREMLFELIPEAYFLGLTHNEVTKQIRQGFFGEEVQRLQKGTDEVKVWVRYPESGRLNVGQLEDMKIKTTNGQEYPLKELAKYSIERGIAGIRHYNTVRSITVEADVVDPNIEVPPIIKKVEDDIVPQMLAQFPGVKIDMGGQSRESAKAQAEIGTFFGMAFLIIFFLIMLTFRSFSQAILIMMMIPLGWVGSAIGHGIEGIPVSLLSAWGMIALSGVIINDAVVFLAKFNSNLKEGMLTEEAAFNAGLTRFRPILLTSITTVLGLFPLIRETSFQAQFLIPMAVSVAYGVLIGTIIILLFFPVLILLFNDVRRHLKWLWTGQKPTREDVERAVIDAKRNALIDELAKDLRSETPYDGEPKALEKDN